MTQRFDLTGKVVVVGISDADIARSGTWPLDRSQTAKLCAPVAASAVQSSVPSVESTPVSVAPAASSVKPPVTSPAVEQVAMLTL